MTKTVSVAVAAVLKTAAKLNHVPKRRLSYEEGVKIQVLMDEGYSFAPIADKVKCIAIAVFLKLF